LLGAKGSPVRSVISDGSSAWFYDPIRRAAWKGAASEAGRLWTVSGEALDLLLKNYSVRIMPGRSRVAGRTCRIVEVLSPQGQLLRRWWLDEEHGVPLKIKAYAADGSVASSFGFTRVEFGARLNEDLFNFSPPPGTEIIPSRRRPNYMDSQKS